MTERYQVIIVGGGPVGAALAVDLGVRGVSCALVERHQTPQRIPKGQNLTARTLEHFYFWGIEDELRGARLMPPGYPIGNVTAYGSLMGEYWYAPRGLEIANRYFFTRNERLPQYLTEEVLRNRLAQLPAVRAMFGRTAKRVEQDDRGVRVTVADDVWPYEETTLEADYVVGCDGARSLVREQMGIGRDGPDYDQRMVLAVLRSTDLHEGLKRFPPATTYRVLKPELRGYWQFFGRIDVGEGFFFHAPVPRDASRDTFDVLRLLREAAGFELQAELDHVGFWDLRILVARQYRKGRAFIAGDACHSHPPYGGFGLNTGLEDAVNLGWKLTAALEGWGGETLLDSYDQERRPIFLEIGEAMIAGGIEADRALLERYNPSKDRAEFEQAWRELQMNDHWHAGYMPHYEGSSVVMGRPGAVCSIHGTHAHAAQAGHHVSPRTLSSGKNVFEELGMGFTLLAFGADDGAARVFEDAAQSLRIPLKVIRDSDEGDRQAYEAKLVLVRPDQYVVWAGNDAPADAPGILGAATGTV
jgi:2-polyprenyl-6-methoxyphenol hydroxylase-like FAD-dependent oxidoreductase